MISFIWSIVKPEKKLKFNGIRED